jgi:hypothetical protein
MNILARLSRRGAVLFCSLSLVGFVATANASFDNDSNGSPAEWQDEFSTGSLPDLAGDVTLGLAYSAGAPQVH